MAQRAEINGHTTDRTVRKTEPLSYGTWRTTAAAAHFRYCFAAADQWNHVRPLALPAGELAKCLRERSPCRDTPPHGVRIKPAVDVVFPLRRAMPELAHHAPPIGQHGTGIDPLYWRLHFCPNLAQKVRPFWKMPENVARPQPRAGEEFPHRHGPFSARSIDSGADGFDECFTVGGNGLFGSHIGIRLNSPR